MTEREDTIERIERVLKLTRKESVTVIIPKFTAERAVTLLKEQEAVEPDVDSEGTCTCGKCGTTIGYYPVGRNVPEKLCKYCPECGQEVKWNEI